MLCGMRLFRKIVQRRPHKVSRSVPAFIQTDIDRHLDVAATIPEAHAPPADGVLRELIYLILKKTRANTDIVAAEEDRRKERRCVVFRYEYENVLTNDLQS